MQSKFSGKCYACGKTWDEGTNIDKTGKKNSKGNDVWCVDGNHCQGQMILEGNPQPPQATSAPQQVPQNDESLHRFAQDTVTAFLAACTSNGLDVEGVKDQVGAVFNTAMITASKR